MSPLLAIAEYVAGSVTCLLVTKFLARWEWLMWLLAAIAMAATASLSFLAGHVREGAFSVVWGLLATWFLHHAWARRKVMT